jgi:hypothetical protein
MNKPNLIDKKILRKIINKKNKSPNLIYSIKNFIYNNSYVIILLLIISAFVFIRLASNKDNFNITMKNIKQKDDEEESYRVTDNSKLSENDYMFKYGEFNKRVMPPKYI